MADDTRKFTELPEADTLTGAEIVAAVQAGTSVQFPVSELAGLLGEITFPEWSNSINYMAGMAVMFGADLYVAAVDNVLDVQPDSDTNSWKIVPSSSGDVISYSRSGSAGTASVLISGDDQFSLVRAGVGGPLTSSVDAFAGRAKIESQNNNNNTDSSVVANSDATVEILSHMVDPDTQEDVQTSIVLTPEFIELHGLAKVFDFSGNLLGYIGDNNGVLSLSSPDFTNVFGASNSGCYIYNGQAGLAAFTGYVSIQSAGSDLEGRATINVVNKDTVGAAIQLLDFNDVGNTERDVVEIGSAIDLTTGRLFVAKNNGVEVFTISADGVVTAAGGFANTVPASFTDGFNTTTEIDNTGTGGSIATTDGTEVGQIEVGLDSVHLRASNGSSETNLNVSHSGATLNGDPIATEDDVALSQRRRVATMHSLWSKLAGATQGIVQWEGGSNVHGEGGGLTGTGSMVDVARLEFANWLGRPDPGLGWVPAFSYSAETPPGNYIFRYGLGFTTASSGALPAGCTVRPDCGLGGYALEVAAGGQTATHTQVGAKFAKVYLTAKKTGGGTAQLFVDGVGVGSPVSTTDGSISGSTSSGKITITWTGTGSTFFVRETGGVNTFIIDGIDFDTNATPIVQHMNGGHGGQDVTNFLNSSTSQHSVNNPADLYVGSWGLNYYFNNGPTPDPNAFLVAIKSWINERHAASPQAGFLLDEQWYGGLASMSKIPPSLSDWLTIWHGVIRDAVAYCESLGIPAMTFSTYELCGDLYDPQPTPADPLSLLAGDKLHPNVRAYKMVGRLTAELMLPGASPTVFFPTDGTGKMTGNVDLNGQALTDSSATPLIRMLKAARILMPTGGGVLAFTEAADGLGNTRPGAFAYASATDETNGKPMVSMGGLLNKGTLGLGEPVNGITSILFPTSASVLTFVTPAFARQNIAAKSLDLDEDATVTTRVPRLSQILPVYNGPTGTVTQTFDRTSATANLALLTSGQVYMVLVTCYAGQVITSLNFIARTQALVSGTNQWAAFCNSARTVLAVSTDATNTAWAANQIRGFTMGTPYTVPTSGVYYFALNVTAGTTPSLLGQANTATAIVSAAPVLHGNSSTAAQTTPPAISTVFGAITADAVGAPYAYAL